MASRLEARIEAYQEATEKRNHTKINDMVQLFEKRISASLVAAKTAKANAPPPAAAQTPPAPPTQNAPTRSQNVIDLRPDVGHDSTATSGPAAHTPPSSSGLTSLA
jgi:hypothetical protein